MNDKMKALKGLKELIEAVEMLPDSAEIIHAYWGYDRDEEVSLRTGLADLAKSMDVEPSVELDCGKWARVSIVLPSGVEVYELKKFEEQ